MRGQKSTDNLIHPDTGLLPLSRLPWQGSVGVDLDEKTPWVAQLLAELSENVDNAVGMVGGESIHLKMRFTFTKTRIEQYGEILLVEGDLSSTFPTLDSSTGVPMLDHINLDFKACFIHHNQKKEVEDPLEEEIDILIGSELYDLYFYVPRGANLMEMAHEYIYLNLNPYPRIGNV